MSRALILMLAVLSVPMGCRPAMAADPIQFDKFIDEYPRFAQLREKLKLGGGAGFYTLHLHHAQEPDLGPACRQGGEAYRLIFMDGGARATRILRVQPSAKGALMVIKDFDALNVYHGQAGELTQSSTSLTADQWNALKALIAKADFWKLPTENKTIGLDGAFYLVEGVANGQHHIVARWNNPPGSLLAVFKYLETLQGAAGANQPPAPRAN